MRDALFTKRDWWIVFKRVPRLRLSLLLGAPLYLFSRRESGHHGFCLISNPKNPLSLQHMSFFNDLLVWEVLTEASRFLSDEIVERIRRGSEKTLAGLHRQGVPVKRDEFSLVMYSYFSPVEYVEKRHPLFRFLVRLMDFAVPDNDTSSIVYSSCAWFASRTRLALQDQWAHDWEMFVRFLGEHVFRKGRFAKGILNYENGVEENDRGVYTWIFENNNEVDATTNVNVLGYLATAFRFLHRDTQALAAEISSGIFRMLGKHAEEGRLASLRFQQYYPPGVALFFWNRFSILWSGLDVSIQQQMDEDAQFKVVDAAWTEWAQKIFLAVPKPYNFADLVWASPFLMEKGIFEQMPERPSPAEVIGNPYLENADYIHVLYPVRLVCLAPGVHWAAFLRSKVIEADREVASALH